MLEIGTGSGYAAAVLGQVAREVFTVERIEALADGARERLTRADNVDPRPRHARGRPEHAPYDAIVVAAGGPKVPEALLAQAPGPGGRLVMPVGPEEHAQVLTRVTRADDTGFRTEALSEVRFVPLIGEQGWPEAEQQIVRAPGKPADPARSASSSVRPLSRSRRWTLRPSMR